MSDPPGSAGGRHDPRPDEGRRPDPTARAAGGSGDGRPPVVVVGLGPVGATVALLVARAGVPVVAIERGTEVYPHPRAVALDDDALRVLQAAGVGANDHPRHHRPGGGAPADARARDTDGVGLLPGGTVRIRGRGGRPLVELGPPPTTTGHPGLAFFRQPQLERTLRDRLEAEPLVDLRLGTTVLGVTSPGGPGRDAVLRVAGQGPPAGRRTAGARTGDPTGDDSGVAPDGSTELRAAWVLACDGGRSPIRTALGIRLRGTTSPSRWLVVDTEAPGGTDGPDGGLTVDTPPRPVEDAPLPVSAPGGGPGPSSAPPFVPGDFEFGADPSGPWVHGPLPGGAHRWEFLLDAATDAGEPADAAVARGLLARRLAGPAPAVHRAAVYAFHARVATRWRVGRVLLLGDAAHLSPPFAGQGLCAGLRDAGNVAWKVAAAWSGTADERLLDTYARERLPHVLRTTALAVALGAVVELRRPRAAALRDRAIGRLAASTAVRDWMDRGAWRPPGTLRRGLVSTDRRFRHRAGEALPQPDVRPRAGEAHAGPARVPGAGAAQSATDAARPAPEGDRLRLDDALPAGWVLLGVPDARPPAGLEVDVVAWGTTGLRRTARPDVTAVPWEAFAGLDALRRWTAPAGVVLVRPDRVVFGSATADDAAALLAAVAATTAFAGPWGA